VCRYFKRRVAISAFSSRADLSGAASARFFSPPPPASRNVNVAALPLSRRAETQACASALTRSREHVSGSHAITRLLARRGYRFSKRTILARGREETTPRLFIIEDLFTASASGQRPRGYSGIVDAIERISDDSAAFTEAERHAIRADSADVQISFRHNFTRSFCCGTSGTLGIHAGELQLVIRIQFPNRA